MSVERDLFMVKLAESKKGLCCPICDRYAKIYNRKLNASMVRALLWFYREYCIVGEAHWIHVADKAPRWMIKSGEFAKLKHWKFLSEQPNTNPDKRNSGCWRLTQKGADFAEAKTTANSRVITYNETILEWDTAQVDVYTSLGREFSYAELMATGAFDRDF